MVLFCILLFGGTCFETDAYEYLTNKCAVTLDGRLLFLNRSWGKPHVLAFNESGESYPFIQHGPGPGELTKASSFFVDGDSFRTKYSQSGDNPMKGQRQEQFVWFNETFEKEQILFRRDSKHDLSNIVEKYNPVQDYDFFVVNRNKDLIFFKEKDSKDIMVFDIPSLKRINKLEISVKARPFNIEWGEKNIASMNSRGFTKVSADFPEYFPLIRWFSVSNDDRLIIHVWNALNPDEINEKDVQAYDFKGNRVGTKFFDLHPGRIQCQMKEGQFIVSRKDSEDAPYSLCVVEEINLEAFIKSHPIVRE